MLPWSDFYTTRVQDCALVQWWLCYVLFLSVLQAMHLIYSDVYLGKKYAFLFMNYTHRLSKDLRHRCLGT